MSAPVRESWGRYPRAAHLGVLAPRFVDEVVIPPRGAHGSLPYGRGRSYGDCCLNDGGTLIDLARLDRLIEFDAVRGVVRCEAGVTFRALLEVIVPRGWFVPVTPGTRELTVGGAIANDVHGKNHHREGTFGRHVVELELLRSDRGRVVCGPQREPELFAATVGGIGLTGVILSAVIRLRKIASPMIAVEEQPIAGFDEFLERSADADRRFEHTVAWIDLLAPASAIGRGVLIAGEHAGAAVPQRPPPRGSLAVPVDAPGWLISPATVRSFNALYRTLRGRKRTVAVRYEPFFYPLDAARGWNRLYGTRGFVQFQCVVANDTAMRTILTRLAASGLAASLGVLKRFGELRSPGILSFPRPGLTLAADLPFDGRPTLDLLAGLHAVVREHGGALYCAKDAAMTREDFRASYPRWRELARLKDPALSSSLWRRVGGDAPWHES